MFEFENTYNLNTEDLNEIFVGSGVHLRKDITLSFSFIDSQDQFISNDIQLKDNPLIKEISYDILDINGNVLYEDYLTNLSTSITITEQDNISLFGSYQKDFGIRAKLKNYINDSDFISQYYLYGNVPKISSVLVIDGSGERSFSENQESIFLTTGFIYENIQLNVNMLNNISYIEYDYIDIYASSNGDLPDINSNNLIYRYSIVNSFDPIQIKISNEYIEYNNLYNLAIVPYSKLGSGNAFYINDVFLSEEEQIVTKNIFSIDTEFELNNGTESLKFNLITGEITGLYQKIDTISMNNGFNVYKYTTYFKYENKFIDSSELKVIFYETGENIMPDMMEYAFNNQNNTNYLLEKEGSNINLIAQTYQPSGFYKLYRTSL